MSFVKSIIFTFFILCITMGVSAQSDDNQTLASTSKGGLSVIYPLDKKISGRVTRADGTPVEVRFYIQDLLQNPPVMVATHINDADGFYHFELGVGYWRVVPISAEFKFEPRAREYDVRLQALRQ